MAKKNETSQDQENLTEEKEIPTSQNSEQLDSQKEESKEGTIPKAAQNKIDEQAKEIITLKEEIELLKSKSKEPQSGENFEKKYDDLKVEFDAYKEAHQKGIEDNANALVEKRKQGQTLINARETIKKLTIEYAKNIENALK